MLQKKKTTLRIVRIKRVDLLKIVVNKSRITWKGFNASTIYEEFIPNQNNFKNAERLCLYDLEGLLGYYYY